MANLKEVRIRITSVGSTQQITKAMKLVSATKLRRAQNGIIQMRPYAQKLNGILANLADSIDVDSLKVYFDQRKVKNVLLVVITSDRGLCGSFNANVVKRANNLVKEKYADNNVTVLPIGKKGADFFAKQPVTLNTSFKESLQGLNSDKAFTIGQYVLDAYRSGKYDVVEIVYNQFKNAATQILTNDQFLPIDAASMSAASGKKNDYLFEPSKVEILEELIPRILKTQVYRSMLDSLASEHGARMVAMDKATDNAGELLKALKVEYNRVRQAAITTEISEIVGGAAALSQG
ncbi:MAG: ATP synthase F1 subunit gamma [Bacteroidota bacterium]